MQITIKTIIDDKDYLRKRTTEVTCINDELMNEIKVLKNYSHKTECFADASIQIGIPKRLVY